MEPHPTTETAFAVKKLITFESGEDNLHYEGVKDIEPLELARKMDDVIVIDVRQPEEFHGELGHIHSSRLIVLDLLQEELVSFPKDKTIVFVCRSGHRSSMACQLAAEMGYQSLYNLKGGMILWNDLHLPTEA
jgi:hydroxyacylglutathione hydrolase